MDHRILVFEVDGVPVPKGRPRLTRTGRAFTPTTTVHYEAHVRECATAAVNEWERLNGDTWPLAGHTYEVRIEAWMGSRKRADVDNLAKSIMDGMSGLTRKSVFGPLMNDDSDVTVLHVKRHAHAKGDAPRALVTVSVL